MIGFLPKINNLIIYIEHHSKRKQERNVMMVICVPNFSFFWVTFFLLLGQKFFDSTANQIVPFLCCVCHQCQNLSKLVTCQIQLFRVFFWKRQDWLIDVQCGFSVIQNQKKSCCAVTYWILIEKKNFGKYFRNKKNGNYPRKKVLDLVFLIWWLLYTKKKYSLNSNHIELKWTKEETINPMAHEKGYNWFRFSIHSIHIYTNRVDIVSVLMHNINNDDDDDNCYKWKRVVGC